MNAGAPRCEGLTEAIMGVIDTVCDRFEAEWKRGQRPRIQNFYYVAPAGGQQRLLLELVALDVEYRLITGDTPSLREYTTLCPEFAVEIEDTFREAVKSVSEVNRCIPSRFMDDAAHRRIVDGKNRRNAEKANPLPNHAPMPVVHSGDATMPGKIGNYEIQGLLGFGGMGIVYKARDLRLNRQVAIKALLGGRTDSTTQAARFRREAAALMKLSHPNIIQLYDVGEHEGVPHLAMEYVDGCNLEQLVRQRPAASRTSVVLVETIARAVQHFHDRGIIHRDLKPANILLAGIDPRVIESRQAQSFAISTMNGLQSHTSASAGTMDLGSEVTPKVIDFGLACDTELEKPDAVTGQIIGTASFMSPEQAFGIHASPVADVYSLGAILYFLLTGRCPFEGRSSFETLLMVQQSEPTRLSHLRPELPSTLNAICSKCLEKSPERRYASAGALADELHRYLSRHPQRSQ